MSCIICGGRGWADAVANLLLYAPLGVALAWNGRVGLRAVGYALILSACIELAQTVIPGRDPSLSDVTFNTFGAAAGQIAALLARRWLVPPDVSAARASLLVAGLGTAVLAITGALLAPALPNTKFSLWYTPALPEMPWYHARVLSTELGGAAIHPGLVSPQAGQLLLSGEPLAVSALAGRPVPALAPLVVLEDDHAEPVVLVGPDRSDLVLRYETRAGTWGLDQPDIRLRAALDGVAPGDTVHVALRRHGVAWCISVNRLDRCGLGFSAGDAWAMVMYPKHWPPWSHTLLGALWIGGLALPVGLWTRWRVESAAAFALYAAALAFVPLAVALVGTPLVQWGGAALGWGVGLALQVMLRRRAA